MKNNIVEGTVISIGSNVSNDRIDCFGIEFSDPKKANCAMDKMLIWHDVKPYPSLTSTLKIGDRVRCTLEPFGFISMALKSIRVFDD